MVVFNVTINRCRTCKSDNVWSNRNTCIFYSGENLTSSEFGEMAKMGILVKFKFGNLSWHMT